MTLTLELPAEVERALEEKARDSGQSVAEYALELLARETAPTPARPRANALLGRYAHLRVSSEDIHREHREEVERDERRFLERSRALTHRQEAP